MSIFRKSNINSLTAVSTGLALSYRSASLAVSSRDDVTIYGRKLISTTGILSPQVLRRLHVFDVYPRNFCLIKFMVSDRPSSTNRS